MSERQEIAKLQEKVTLEKKRLDLARLRGDKLRADLAENTVNYLLSQISQLSQVTKEKTK